MKRVGLLLDKIRFRSFTPLEKVECLTQIKKTNRLRGRSMERFLVSVLRKDHDPIVRHEAAFVIAHVREQKRINGSLALEALCSSMQHDRSLVVRHEALEALGHFPKEKSLKIISKFIYSKNQDLRATAKIGLAKINKKLFSNS